ncbi:MAG: hypothetical protein ACRD59_07790 [Candidatus Acidiferrales bacterium]
MSLKRAAVAIAVLLSPSALDAQGCAMCYQSAASSGSQFIQALRHGILIMFFPPILIMAAIYYAAYRKRNQFNTVEGGTSTENAYGEDVPPEWTLADDTYLRKLVENEQ